MAAYSEYPEPPHMGRGRKSPQAIARPTPVAAIGSSYASTDDPDQADATMADWEARADRLERERLAQSPTAVRSTATLAKPQPNETPQSLRQATTGPTHGARNPGPTPSRRDGNLTGRGAFFLVFTATALACGIGFFTSGATLIPALASWGLLLGSILAALLVKRTDRAVALWSPPIAMALTIGLLGQITMLGSTYTLTREVGMFLAAMSSSAPMQLLAVVIAFVILRLRFRDPRSAQPIKADLGESTSAPRGAIVELPR